MTTRPLQLLAPVLWLPLAGCPIGNDRYLRPIDLDPSWRIDRLRVLAVQAEPPEARPGEEVRFNVLLVDPQEQAGGVLWIACPPERASGSGFGCGLSGDLDFASDGASEGIIGFQPGLNPRYTPPDTILDELDENERYEGVYQLIQVAAIPQRLLDDGFGEGDFGGDIDFGEVAVAYKRLVVSEAITPNRNPEIAGFSVDGWVVPPDTVVEVDPEERYDIGVFLPESSLERYIFVRSDGTLEYRREEPFVSWYADGGTIQRSDSLFPFLDTPWRAPPADAEITEGSWWAVVRDRRGGMAWTQVRWRLRSDNP